MSEAEPLSPEKERQILHGAGAVFAADGYEGASMSRIAHEAGVSKGTLYNYFSGKADLFGAYVRQECTVKLAQMFIDVDPAADPAVVLRDLGERMVGMILSPVGLTIYRVVVAEAIKFPELARSFYEAGPQRATAQMATWLREQSRAGRLRVDDPEFAAEQFFALCQTRLGMKGRLRLLPEPLEGEVARVVEGAVTLFLNTYGVTQDQAGGQSRLGKG